MAEAIRIPTVAHEDRSCDDTEALGQMHTFLAETYPLVHQYLHREVVAEHSLLYRWDGRDASASPVLLMAHIDVVPVEPGTEDDWEHPPFSGERADGFVWGRGAVDDKGALVAIFEAVESLLAQGFEPDTTLYISIGHDEEIGGGLGASSVARLLADRGVRLDFVLDEGGAVAVDMLPGAKAPVALLGIGEKGYLNVELTATDAGGHSSVPPKSTAVGKLAAAIRALEQHPMPARLEVQRGFFEAIAVVLPAPQAVAVRNPDLFSRLIERRMSAAPQTNALIRTTTAVTMAEGGVKPNLLPQQARAVANFRIMPGDTPASVIAHVRSQVGEGVTARPLAAGFTSDPSPLSDPESAAFRLIADVIGDVFDGVAVAPWILMGATDSRYFAPIADNVYRFTPFRMGPTDLQRIHGTGERVRVDDADPAVAFYERLVRRACGPG